MKRLLLMGLLLSAGQAQASTVWGSSGLVTMPDAQVLRGRELELGAHYLTLPAKDPAIAGFLRYGILEGLEASVLYGVPNHPWVTGGLKYQLLAPSPDNPMAVAIGMALPGVPSDGAIAGTHYFMALSRNLSPAWGTLHLGFMGDLALNSRLMVGWEVPLGRWGAIKAEGFGPQPGTTPNANVGVSLTPFDWLSFSAASLGDSSHDVLLRGMALGASARMRMPDFFRFWPKASPPLVRPTPAPMPSSSPSVPGRLAPPALPAATLIGRILGEDGAPRSDLQVRLVGKEREARSTASGYFFFPGLLPGHYGVQVLEADGRLAVEAETDIREGGPSNLTIALTDSSKRAVMRRGTIAGTVLSGEPLKPLAGARVTIAGNALSVLAMSSEDGRFRVIDLPPGEYSLKAERPGYATGTGVARLAESDLQAEVMLKLNRGEAPAAPKIRLPAAEK